MITTIRKITEEERFFDENSPFEKDDAFRVEYTGPVSDGETFHALIDFAAYCGVVDAVTQSHVYRDVEAANYLKFRIFESDIPRLINLLPQDGQSEVTICRLTEEGGNELFYDKYVR